jgi:hypothetical protein
MEGNMSTLRKAIIFLLVGLLLCAWSLPPDTRESSNQSDQLSAGLQAPLAAGDTVRVTVQNKTGAVLSQLVFAGPKTYTFTNVPIGKSTYEILKGKYTIQYKACGANRSKRVTILSNYKFTTVGCPLAKVNVINESSGMLFLNLKGPVDYRFVIPPGTTPINVVKGTYEFTGTLPCGSSTGTIKVKGRMRWNWWCT